MLASQKPVGLMAQEGEPSGAQLHQEAVGWQIFEESRLYCAHQCLNSGDLVVALR